MKPIHIGIIGVGQIGKHHLNNYKTLEGAEVVAIADIDTIELERVGKEHAIPNLYNNAYDLLKQKDIEAVDVCLHNNLHRPATEAALKAGKHVYCEKPMAGSYIDAFKMLETAKVCKCKLSIQLATLFLKETKVAQRLIQEGHLGKVYHARSTGYRRRGRPFVDGYGKSAFVQKEVAAGGALYDMGVYHIAQLLYLLDLPKVERISGKIYQETDMDAKRREISRYNVEELGLGFVKLAKGITMDILESWAIHLNAFEGSNLVGSQGGIRLQPFSFHSTLSDVALESSTDLDAQDWRWHQLEENQDAYDSPQAHWIAALQKRVKLLPTAEIALATMLISEGIYLSDRLGREVTPDEVMKMSKSSVIEL